MRTKRVVVFFLIAFFVGHSLAFAQARKLDTFRKIAPAQKKILPPANPPSAPTLYEAKTVSGSQVNLMWTVPVENVQGFKVERKTESGPFVEIASYPENYTEYKSLFYYDRNLQSGTAYTYRVRAYHNSGAVSNYSNELSATTYGVKVKPATPTLYEARTVSGSQVNLMWTVPVENIHGFKVERRTADGPFIEIASYPGNYTEYKSLFYYDRDLTSRTSYTYRVRAYNDNGSVSEYSNELTTTTY